jgi:polyribonucleotide nucleotidyltransferase
MDIKIDGVSREILASALDQARRGRLHILDEMKKAIDRPRDDYSPHAPRLLAIRINPEKIGTIIGPGGKMIRQIQEETGTTVEVEDDGTVKVFSTEGDGAKRA